MYPGLSHSQLFLPVIKWKMPCFYVRSTKIKSLRRLFTCYKMLRTYAGAVSGKPRCSICINSLYSHQPLALLVTIFTGKSIKSNVFVPLSSMATNHTTNSSIFSFCCHFVWKFQVLNLFCCENFTIFFLPQQPSLS